MIALAAVIQQPGPPEVIGFQEQLLPEPAPDEVQIKQKAIGINFIDIYHRCGVYPVPLPSGLGVEAAGVITKVGSRVTEFSVGARVAYISPEPGSYATARNVAARYVVALPSEISFERAAASFLKGLTALMLVDEVAKIRSGEQAVALVHAAAGAVGMLLVAYLKHLGIRVIGVVGSEAKRAEALRAGCDAVLIGSSPDWFSEARRFTSDRGVDVVFDGVGAATFEGSLAALRPFGLLVSFGNASGKIAPFDPLLLAARGSLKFARPTVFTLVEERARFVAASDKLFRLLASGALPVHIGQSWRLAEAALAHRALEARTTQGSSLILP